MARRRTGQRVTPGKGSSTGQRKSNPTRSIVPRTRSVRYLPERSQSARSRVIQALGDVRAGRVSNLTQALANRETTLKSARKYLGAHLKQSHPGGPITVAASDNLRFIFPFPTVQRGELVIELIKTTNSKERKLYGEWWTAVQEAGRGDFDRLRKFPKGVVIDGRLLPTGPYQVQKILTAMAESDKKIEAFYVSTRGTQ